MRDPVDIYNARKQAGLPTFDPKTKRQILEDPWENENIRAQPGWRMLERSQGEQADTPLPDQYGTGSYTPRQLVESAIGKPENPIETIGQILKGGVKGGVGAALAIPAIGAVSKIPVIGGPASILAAGVGGAAMVKDILQKTAAGLAERATGGRFSDVVTPEYAGEIAGGLAVGGRYGKELESAGKTAGEAIGEAVSGLMPSARQAAREAAQRNVLEAMASRDKWRDTIATHAIEHQVPDAARYRDVDAEIADTFRLKPKPFEPEEEALKQAEKLYGDQGAPAAPESTQPGNDLRARLWHERQQILPRGEPLGAAALDERGHLMGELPSPSGEVLNAEVPPPSLAPTAWSPFQDQIHRRSAVPDDPIQFEKIIGPSSPLIGAGKTIAEVLGIDVRQPTPKQFSRGITPEEAASQGLPYEAASYGPAKSSALGRYERGGMARKPSDAAFTDDALTQAALQSLINQKVTAPEAEVALPKMAEQAGDVGIGSQANAPLWIGPPKAPSLEGQSITEPGKALPFGLPEQVDLSTLKVSPKEYQYKSGGDVRGVTGKLAGLTAKDFDPLTWDGSTLIVHERANGDRFVADGHQRLPFGQMVERARGEPLPTNAIVLRENDGWTVPEVRAQAAMKNIREESGSPSDAAMVLKANPLAQLNGTTGFLRQAVGLSKLGDDALAAVRAGDIQENHAAHIGNLFDDPAIQSKVVQELRRLKPKNDIQAVSMLNDIRRLGFREVGNDGQVGLPGFDVVTESLMKHRADVLDEALGNTKAMAGLLKRVNKGADLLTEKGNVVNTEGNQEAVTDAKRLIERIQAEAGLTGPVSDALDQAAEFRGTGAKLSSVADRFIKSVLTLYRRK